MPDYVIAAPAQPSLPIRDSAARFPVRRIYCVGRNYAEHAREMGHDPDREPPFFFSKPADALLPEGQALAYPPQTRELHHEVELVVALASGGRDIAVEAAAGHIWGYGIGCDLTLRDLQGAAKKMGRPWDLSKGFDGSATCGALVAKAAVGPLTQGAISLLVNGEERQRGDLADMIWNTVEVIAYLSRFVELKAGDLIYTGTPAGVGTLQPGDTCRLQIEGLGAEEFKVVA